LQRCDVKSLVIHPKTTTHSQLSEAEFNEQKIFDSTIRLSIGTEQLTILLKTLTLHLKQLQNKP
jgi:O-acetylhomoserine (thiol)-lyase